MNTSLNNTKACQHGSVMVECAITLLPFTILLIGFLQLSIAAFHTVSLQYVLNRTSRWASVGNGAIDGKLPVNEVRRHARQLIDNLGLGTDGLTLHLCPATNPDCSTDNDAGSSQYMVITASKPAEQILGFGSMPILAQILVKNEPF